MNVDIEDRDNHKKKSEQIDEIHGIVINEATLRFILSIIIITLVTNIWSQYFYNNYIHKSKNRGSIMIILTLATIALAILLRKRQ